MAIIGPHTTTKPTTTKPTTTKPTTRATAAGQPWRPCPVRATGNRVLRTVIAAVSVLAGGAGCAATSMPQPADGAANAVVVAIVDGDTLDVIVGGETTRVRLLGLDTPESVDPNRPPQCFGAESTRRLQELAPPGTPLLLVRDVLARDRFDRLLAYLYRPSDGLFINHSLVREGFADVVIHAPNDTLAPALRVARADAVREGRGLWSACDGPDQPLVSGTTPAADRVGG